MSIWWENITYSIGGQLEVLQAEMNVVGLENRACVLGRENEAGHGS